MLIHYNIKLMFTCIYESKNLSYLGLIYIMWALKTEYLAATQMAPHF